VKNQKFRPTGSKFTALKQICNFIPGHLVSKVARETGADQKAREFSNWSHVVSLLKAQLEEFDLADALIDDPDEGGTDSGEVAERMKTSQSFVGRLEGGSVTPTRKSLQR
jgi:hypothetical protein